MNRAFWCLMVAALTVSCSSKQDKIDAAIAQMKGEIKDAAFPKSNRRRGLRFLFSRALALSSSFSVKRFLAAMPQF